MQQDFVEVEWWNFISKQNLDKNLVSRESESDWIEIRSKIVAWQSVDFLCDEESTVLKKACWFLVH